MLDTVISLIAPVSYLLILCGSLSTFGSLYRKRKAAKAAALEPWFGPHTTRDIYLSLMHMEGDDAPPDHVLKAALIVRAKEDIKRLMQLRNSKQSLQQLLQRSSVGDDLWTRFQAAEAEMDEELRDVVGEANAFKEGWGQMIFQTANEMVNHDRLLERAAQVAKEAERERKWWDEQRERASKELLEEGSDSDGVLVEKSKAKK